jgi:hypothetical protein
MEPMQPMQPMAPMSPMTADKWWPDDLGQPSSTGAQNGVRYAFFRAAHRLLIDQDGQREIYDSGKHVIAGVAQSNADNTSLTFATKDGPVELSELTRIK